MVLFRVRLRVHSGLRQSVLESLLRMVSSTCSAKGCLACHAYRDIQNEDAILYLEEWQTQEDLDEHLRSRPLKLLLAVIDLSTGPPEVRFDTIEASRGMEVIAAARLPRGS